MRKALLIFTLLFVFFCKSSADELGRKFLTNGDFEKDLSVGWTKNASGLYSYSDVITRDTILDSDHDYEVILEKVDDGYIKLFQTVDVLISDMQFSVKAKLDAQEYNPDAAYWSAAAVCLKYLNTNNELLGETRITNKSPHCPWKNTDSLHIIQATNAWQSYNVNINKELNNLPEVKPSAVKKLQVMLLVTSNGC